MAILIPTAIPVAFSLDGGSYGLTTIICLGGGAGWCHLWRPLLAAFGYNDFEFYRQQLRSAAPCANTIAL